MPQPSLRLLAKLLVSEQRERAVALTKKGLGTEVGPFSDNILCLLNRLLLALKSSPCPTLWESIIPNLSFLHYNSFKVVPT